MTAAQPIPLPSPEDPATAAAAGSVRASRKPRGAGTGALACTHKGCGKSFKNQRALNVHQKFAHVFSKKRRAAIAAKRVATAKATREALQSKSEPTPKTTTVPMPVPVPTPTVVMDPVRRGRPRSPGRPPKPPTAHEVPTLADAIDYLQTRVDFTQGIINEFRQFATKFGGK